MAEAVGYVRSFAGEEFRAVHVRKPSTPPICATVEGVLGCGRRAGTVPKGDAVRALIDFVRAIPREERDFITVVVPEKLTKRSVVAPRRRRAYFGLKLRLL